MQIRLTRDLEEKHRAAPDLTVDAFLGLFPEVPRDLRGEPVVAEYVRAFGPQLQVAEKPSPCVARDGGGDAKHFFYTRLINDLAIYGIGLAKRERTLQRLEKLPRSNTMRSLAFFDVRVQSLFRAAQGGGGGGGGGGKRKRPTRHSFRRRGGAF